MFFLAFDAESNGCGQSATTAANDDGAARLLGYFENTAIVQGSECIHAGSPRLGSATGADNSVDGA